MSSFTDTQPIAPKSHVIARVVDVTPIKLSLSLPGGMMGRVALTDICDCYHDDPTAKFSIGQYVEGSVVSVDDDKSEAHVSLRRSR